MRAIKIDPNMATVEEVELDNEDLYAQLDGLLQGEYFEYPLIDGHLLLVGKDHANLEATNFRFRDQPFIAGTALIVAMDVVGFSDATWSVEDVKEDIEWQDNEAAQ